MPAAESFSQSEPKAMKAHEIIAKRLRDQILRGELTAGQRLPPEDELTEQFGIARTTLREALRVLESQGLLTIRRGRGGGPEVTHPDLTPAATALSISLRLDGVTMVDLDEARRTIEPQLAGQLARVHTDADITALREAIELAHVAAERGDTVAFGVAADLVHFTLTERSANRTLSTLARLLHELQYAYYIDVAAGAAQQQMRRAVRSYRRLVEYIVAGDADGAVQHWTKQMTYTITRVDRDRPLPLPRD